MPVQIHNIMLISTERKGGVLGKKAIRSINVDWDTWYEAKRILKADGHSLSEAIEGFLKTIIKKEESSDKSSFDNRPWDQ